MAIRSLVAFAGMRLYVPVSEQRTFQEIETGERRPWNLANELLGRGVTVEQVRGVTEESEPGQSSDLDE